MFFLIPDGTCSIFWKILILENYRIFEFFDFGKLRYYYNNKRRYDPPLVFRFSVFWGISGLRDRSWRILRKIPVPNDPFSWRLLPPVSRKFGTQDFLLNVWRLLCSFSRSKNYSSIKVC